MSLGLKIEINVSKKQDYGSEMLTQPFVKKSLFLTVLEN